MSVQHLVVKTLHSPAGCLLLYSRHHTDSYIYMLGERDFHSDLFTAFLWPLLEGHMSRRTQYWSGPELQVDLFSNWQPTTN